MSTPKTYTTVSNMEARYGTDRLAELTGDATGVTISGEVQKAIDTFASWMNPRIAVRYPTMPFDADEPFLNALNTEGAFYELKKAHPAGLTEEEERLYKALIKELDKIASGVNVLTLPESAPEPESPRGTFTANPRLFGLPRRRPDYSETDQRGF